MSQLLIKGGRRLRGEVTLQGPRTACCPSWRPHCWQEGQVALLGCPRLRDVDASIRILRHLGCDARWEGTAWWWTPPP